MGREVDDDNHGRKNAVPQSSGDQQDFEMGCMWLIHCFENYQAIDLQPSCCSIAYSRSNDLIFAMYCFRYHLLEEPCHQVT